MGAFLALLPHLDVLDFHATLLGVCRPSGEPFVLGLPELAGSVSRIVGPWLFISKAVLEVAVGASDGYVEDEVELLVERCGVGVWGMKGACLARIEFLIDGRQTSGRRPALFRTG